MQQRLGAVAPSPMFGSNGLCATQTQKQRLFQNPKGWTDGRTVGGRWSRDHPVSYSSLIVVLPRCHSIPSILLSYCTIYPSSFSCIEGRRVGGL